MKAVSVLPSVLVARWVVVIAVLAASAGCATSDEVKLRMQVAELQQERNDLIRYALKQDEYIRQLEGGMILQAHRNAQLLDGCDI